MPRLALIFGNGLGMALDSLVSLGFSQRTRGSHHIFSHPDVLELINLQRDGGKAKPYQVRQVRAIILQYKLGANE